MEAITVCVRACGRKENLTGAVGAAEANGKRHEQTAPHRTPTRTSVQSDRWWRTVDLSSIIFYAHVGTPHVRYVLRLVFLFFPFSLSCEKERKKRNDSVALTTTMARRIEKMVRLDG